MKLSEFKEFLLAIPLAKIKASKLVTNDVRGKTELLMNAGEFVVYYDYFNNKANNYYYFISSSTQTRSYIVSEDLDLLFRFIELDVVVDRDE